MKLTLKRINRGTNNVNVPETIVLLDEKDITNQVVSISLDSDLLGNIVCIQLKADEIDLELDDCVVKTTTEKVYNADN